MNNSHIPPPQIFCDKNPDGTAYIFKIQIPLDSIEKSKNQFSSPQNEELLERKMKNRSSIRSLKSKKSMPKVKNNSKKSSGSAKEKPKNKVKKSKKDEEEEEYDGNEEIFTNKRKKLSKSTSSSYCQALGNLERILKDYPSLLSCLNNQLRSASDNNSPQNNYQNDEKCRPIDEFSSNRNETLISSLKCGPANVTVYRTESENFIPSLDGNFEQNCCYPGSNYKNCPNVPFSNYEGMGNGESGYENELNKCYEELRRKNSQLGRSEMSQMSNANYKNNETNQSKAGGNETLIDRKVLKSKKSMMSPFAELSRSDVTSINIPPSPPKNPITITTKIETQTTHTKHSRKKDHKKPKDYFKSDEMHGKKGAGGEIEVDDEICEKELRRESRNSGGKVEQIGVPENLKDILQVQASSTMELRRKCLERLEEKNKNGGNEKIVFNVQSKPLGSSRKNLAKSTKSQHEKILEETTDDDECHCEENGLDCTCSLPDLTDRAEKDEEEVEEDSEYLDEESQNLKNQSNQPSTSASAQLKLKKAQSSNSKSGTHENNDTINPNDPNEDCDDDDEYLEKDENNDENCTCVSCGGQLDKLCRNYMEEHNCGQQGPSSRFKTNYNSNYNRGSGPNARGQNYNIGPDTYYNNRKTTYEDCNNRGSRRSKCGPDGNYNANNGQNFTNPPWRPPGRKHCQI